VKPWLAANPRVHVHFTPTSGSWLNLVEVWFGIIDRQAIHRGTFASVHDLMIKIRAFINGWNGLLGSVQGLDPGLLVDAEHDRVLRRVRIQPDDIGDLCDQLRVRWRT
jgi:hypothetical protein